ncbi:ATPase, AAA family protein [Coccidioides posadasii C735 delta SOWgp]|uniref:ATPase, AAA family protein n=1 Tax=Coccidioides posadasii (strain C735) TaxID=222929 RepID=C5NZE0_COCP7|nr:ATPase, AAA family protein [Coccidioides posadasii C735 delta SOWgp]EER29833.1 ATPase, AAA family protein [Coccidioides posadasii C735 delta SOWgp]|eukprot:XP_003071978.1 ATPase, AAA family protein [Coccidioides posadasii C735 delta SOWgp]
MRAWLIENFAVLSLGQEIISFDSFNSAYVEYLEAVRVVECTGLIKEGGGYHLSEVNLDVQAYQLQPSCLESSSQTQGATDPASDEEALQARIISLPNEELDGLWESLWQVWDIDPWCLRALAQKLAIRLGKQFPQSKLVEINAISLSSKYFSESGKLVAKMFENVETLLKEEPETLMCVFIDEVETITANREQSLKGNDPPDAMRAVNSLLTALDRLRQHPNVLVLCTSNLINALDSAFLDRVDIKQFVPLPSVRGVYEIFRSCLENLSQCGLIEGATFEVVQRDTGSPGPGLEYMTRPAEALGIPRYEMALWYRLFSRSIPKRLENIAEASVGLSGRTLRRIPALSLVLYTTGACCSVDEAVDALEQGVEEELRIRQAAQEGQQTAERRGM